MTLDDLRISMNNFMPTWVEIEEAEDGEIIIRTGLKESGHKNGELVPIDD
jgi:hypothetical protein